MKVLPKVDNIYTYLNDGLNVAVESLLKAGVKRIVVVGSGAGSIYKNQKNLLIDIAKSGKAVVVRSSRTDSGYVSIENYGIVSADNLNPQKARVLLTLALTKTKEPKEI